MLRGVRRAEGSLCNAAQRAAESLHDRIDLLSRDDERWRQRDDVPRHANQQTLVHETVDHHVAGACPRLSIARCELDRRDQPDIADVDDIGTPSANARRPASRSELRGALEEPFVAIDVEGREAGSRASG